MDELLKSLKALNEEIDHILTLQVFEGLEILNAKPTEEKPKRKKVLQRKRSLKKGETVIRYMAPDGNQVKVDFKSDMPVLSIETLE
jgi:hypothetical protein